jgi:hypothetical protein
MSSTPIKLGHQWVAFTIAAVELIVDNEGQPRFFDDLQAEPMTTYGCSICNMGQDEGVTIACPGYDPFEEPTP